VIPAQSDRVEQHNPDQGGDGPVRQLGELTSPSSFGGLWAYVEVTKPASVLLLVFTGLGAMIVAAGGWHLSPGLLIRILPALALGCAGANTITCYLDQDIDQVMERTRRRPIPSGRIRPSERALLWGLLLTVVSLALAWTISPLVFLLGLLGFADNVLIYSLLLKRRSAWNIILGGFSGGIPVLSAWAAVRGNIDLVALLMAAVVVLWIPNHIWNLAIYHAEDYRKVRVPMLPAVVSLEKTTRCTVATVVLMFLLSLALYFVGGLGLFYLLTALVCGLFVTVSNLLLALHPSREKSWVMFKLSSPYLFVLFLAMAIDVFLA
jgi:protoheme IX farnesyltransferase